MTHIPTAWRIKIYDIHLSIGPPNSVLIVKPDEAFSSPV